MRMRALVRLSIVEFEYETFIAEVEVAAETRSVSGYPTLFSEQKSWSGRVPGATAPSRMLQVKQQKLGRSQYQEGITK